MPSGRRKSYFAKPTIECLESRTLYATWQPFSYANNSTGSIRETLDAIAPGDTIDLRAYHGTITLQWNLVLDKSVTLLGPGSDRLTINMLGTGGRLIEIAPGLTVNISGLRLDGGNSGQETGGGIEQIGEQGQASTLNLHDVYVSNCLSTDTGGGLSAEYANVTMTDCRFTGNTAASTMTATGGGVALTGCTLSATDCTFDNNAAHASGVATGYTIDPAALGGGVAVMSADTTAFTNCTFFNNNADADFGASNGNASPTSFGGGLCVAALGNVTLVNDTFAQNAATGDAATTFGGGIGVLGFGNYNDTTPTVLKVVNTVIAGDTATNGPDAFGLGVTGDSATANLKYDVIGVADDSGIANGVDHNLAGTAASPLNAMLNPLTDNGGGVATMYPQAGSPVLGVASSAESPGTDARGYARSPLYDVGAVERQSDYAPTLTTFPDDTAAAFVPYVGRLVAADVEGDPISFSLASGPAWLSVVDAGNGTAQLVGTPGIDDVGVQHVVVRTSDGHLTFDQPVEISVTTTPVSLSGAGVLRVIGTDAADAIHVWQKTGTGGAVRVAIGKRLLNYPVDAVRSIQVFGLGGDDVIVANCVDLGAYIQAGEGNDTIVGGDQADSITAAQGNDSVLGMGGDDWIDGNAGSDTIDGGAGNDRIYGGSGNDLLVGNTGNDVLYGEEGVNTYRTNDHAKDWVFGTSPGHDFVDDGDTKDLLYGALFTVPPVAAKHR